MPQARHTCPVEGCGRAIGRDRHLCREHWMRVPQAVRAEVWEAWREYQQAPSIEAVVRLRAAQTAATAAVDAKLKEET